MESQWLVSIQHLNSIYLLEQTRYPKQELFFDEETEDFGNTIITETSVAVDELHPKFLRHSINRYNMVYSDTTSIDQCNILEEPSFFAAY